MSKLKVTTLFSGIGAQEAGLKRLGVDFEMVGMCEIDKYAIKSYEGINGPTHNYGDISKIDRLDYADLLVYSSPCFPRGSMVLTDGGYKDIADIQVGDKVLTHLGNWKPVIRTMNNGVKELVKLSLNDGNVIRCTPNHKFLCRDEMVDCENAGEWVEAQNIGKKYPIWIKNGERGYGWVTSYEKDGKEEVFDIEVEDDHSFTVYDYIVHNCQDFSLAGRQAGLVSEDGKQTRSGLLLEVGRLLMKMSDEGILPKYLLMENVKNLVGKKFKPAFDVWLKALEAIGYNNYWKVLNAKDYGVPQNRERVFVVSIRKDVDTHGYTFPEPFKLNRRLKDVLETNVDEKYYLKQDLVETFIKRLAKREVSNTIRCGSAGSIDQKHTWDLVAEPSIVQNPHGYNNGGIIKDNVAPTMTSNGSYHLNNFVCNEPLIAASRGRNPDNPLSREAGLPTEQMLEINQSGCSNTLTTVGKDNLVVEPNVLVQKRTEYGKMIRKDYEAGIIRESRHNMTELSPRTDGICNTITTVQKDNYLCEPKINVLGNYKPSGHECGRVMGVDGVSPTIKENHGAVYSIAEPQIKQLGNVFPTKTRDNPNQGRVYDENGLSPALNCMGGGNREPCVCEGLQKVGNIYPSGGQNGNVYCTDGISPTISSGQGVSGNGIGSNNSPKIIQPINAYADGTAPALTAHLHKETVNDCTKLDRHSPALGVKEVGSEIRIRKLTPKECWRLMDFTDEEYEAAEKAGVSKTQLYKQAGNSIVVSCLAHIFRELLKDTEYEPEEGFKTGWLERLKGKDNA